MVVRLFRQAVSSREAFGSVTLQFRIALEPLEEEDL
jgi:hypothetical protein